MERNLKGRLSRKEEKHDLLLEFLSNMKETEKQRKKPSPAKSKSIFQMLIQLPKML